ncbi:hypothetical protein KP001_12020 [Geomonas subterranea]|uniref:Uncharacterized protein n=1 Tax=Geomonas subterranea TaxID=2847989 RepID=A0ABX8LCP7_9BACT|nr:hypothetical protein [Geomonas subterranea]QXE89172.1 hypothetical protein KP001_11910 [Geomonas subterranea]QXE89194.1 hypothetical protein KP001_12020 [Geomonas subterranea]QXM08693.1 hypothetical protein KP002_17255 [Geomonas subterranea]QXM08711.1 hypothetical protein KP002_17365 [Geomonas subterranea]
MQSSESIEIHFNHNAPASHEFLLEPRQAPLSSRIRQLTQDLEVDISNQPDEPNEFETREWEEDFEAKADALSGMFQQAMNEELYIELFGSLESKCHVLADERKKTAKSFYDLDRIIQEHNDVLLYNQEFVGVLIDPQTKEKKWYPKDYDALVKFRCFVDDIDKVNAGNIQAVIDMIMTAPILPNYINLTGNGIHLYFLFDATHDMKHSAWRMAYVNDTTIESERNVYINVKQEMIKWFKGSTAYSDVSNHLAQPSRLAGSKTKNRNKRTILFKVSDTKYSIQHIAGLFNIDLPDEESIRQWKKKVDADKKRWKKAKGQSNHVATLLDFTDPDDASGNDMVHLSRAVVSCTDMAPDVDHANPNSKYRFDFTEVVQRVLSDYTEHMNSPEEKLLERFRRLRAESKAKAEADPRRQQRKIAGRRGLESQYNQFKQQMFNGVHGGNRANALHIFWSRAAAYQKNEDVIFTDFCDLLSLCNSMRGKKITEKQVSKILCGPRIKYPDDSIFKRTGIMIVMTNSKNKERQKRKDNKTKKWELILKICESELLENDRLSDRQLTTKINAFGIPVSNKTISSSLKIKELRAKLNLQ